MKEIPEDMNNFFGHPWVRKLTIFFITYVATRNLKTAFLLFLLFILFSRYLMNENSKANVISSQRKKNAILNKKKAVANSSS